MEAGPLTARCPLDAKIDDPLSPRARLHDVIGVSHDEAAELRVIDRQPTEQRAGSKPPQE